MRRLLVVITIAAAAATAGLLSAIHRPIAVNSTDRTLAFDGFPLDRPRLIEFAPPEPESGEASLYTRFSSRANGTDLDDAVRREVTDQIRDWLLITVMSSSRLTADELNQALFDLPPVRRGQFERIAKFDYGETRARAVANGEVVALIPARSAEQRTDALAHIADDERKNTGRIPTTVHVFEYELGADLSHAQITHRASVDGATLFSAAAGYAERRVQSLSDLEQFMSSVDDLTYAQRDGAQLTLGGRRILSRQYRGIRVEDVAAIWQSEQSPEGRSHGSGFSLDPEFEYSNLTRIVQTDLGPRMVRAGAPEVAVAEMRQALVAKDIGAFLRSFQSACRVAARVPEDCPELGRKFLLSHRYQAARYDGKLAGTEVGMVLFYTDLLMKLWSLDYQHSVPGPVAGFPNETAMEVAAIYRTEVQDFPATRLWLGSLDEGYQIGLGGREVSFARIATRVFAVPNDPITGKDRTESAEPHVYDRVFMTWWNDHYEEVGRYEPEYERLNEIMKWSQLIVWLNTSNDGHLLEFLAAVDVNRSNRFTEWVRRHPELTFRNWSAIDFKPAGYESSRTEALAILASEPFQNFGRISVWEGGVSLARPKEFLQRSALSDDVPALLRRGRLDYSKSNLASGELKTLQSVEYTLRNTGGNTASSVARVPTPQRLRGLISEFRHSDLERTIVKRSDGLVLQARAVNADVGDLHVGRTPEGFRIAWRAREVDQGQTIARRLSRAPSIDVALMHDPSVDSVVKLPQDGEYLIKPIDGDRWMRLRTASGGDKVVRQGYDARVSGTGSGSRTVDVAWIDREIVAKQMNDVGWVRVSVGQTRESMIVSVESRGPPAGSRPHELRWAGGHIQAFEDGTDGRLLINSKALPSELRQDPGRLRRLVDAQPATHDPEGVIAMVARADYDRAAAAFAKNPAEFRQTFEARLTEDTLVVNRLMQENRFVEARQRIDSLLAICGDQPELRLRRALADLADHDVPAAARTLDAVFKRPVNASFFEEIDKRLSDPRLAAPERDAMTNIRRLAEWRSQKAAGANRLRGNLVAVTDNNTLRLDYRVDTLDAHAVSVSDVDANPLLYVQDSPGLNNVDWSPSTHSTLNSLVSSGRVDVSVLDVDLAHFSPARIVEAHSKTSLKLVAPMPVLHAGAGLTGSPRPPSCADQDAQRPNCRVYLVRERYTSLVAHR
ncbi:MAG TPA: hypothetical protein VKE51_23445 [Vicinamibacterales bacterium]|nr:hypothetical protein [Vicinamibacterales bacterium]